MPWGGYDPIVAAPRHTQLQATEHKEFV